LNTADVPIISIENATIKMLKSLILFIRGYPSPR
jgi:hypothetical protein